MTLFAKYPFTLLHAGLCGVWPPVPEEEAEPIEIAQGWDSLCPRPVKRGNWDSLPYDVHKLFDMIDIASREKAGLTANLSQLSEEQRKRHYQKLRCIQDRLCIAARDLSVREAKSILLNADGVVIGVAEYQGARRAVELAASITKKLGAEHAIPQAQPSRTEALLTSLDKDGAVFLEAVRGQMAAGDVQYEEDGCS